MPKIRSLHEVAEGVYRIKTFEVQAGRFNAGHKEWIRLSENKGVTEFLDELQKNDKSFVNIARSPVGSEEVGPLTNQYESWYAYLPCFIPMPVGFLVGLLLNNLIYFLVGLFGGMAVSVLLMMMVPIGGFGTVNIPLYKSSYKHNTVVPFGKVVEGVFKPKMYQMMSEEDSVSELLEPSGKMNMIMLLIVGIMAGVMGALLAYFLMSGGLDAVTGKQAAEVASNVTRAAVAGHA